ncbi:phage head closure protein [Staphylococcus delphini]|uniref:phage head closure protein n=1 Tax=Staphylococcus delphini TaxID=53344 RepID=UPI0021D39433|nr:phage head closure protein [Staphylococcus delphini]UXS43743.1 phage head closure protein [Staphylococcus delphini]UXV46344.1 phage head closure protein [Staphylococcus delphini]
MFDPFNEYPHFIEVGRIKIVGKYPNQRKQFVADRTIQGFMDTPTTSETLNFYQMDKSFDRNLYTPYNVKISTNNVFRYESKLYQVIGYPVDQGGMHEVNLTRLQEVPNGKG